MSAFARAARPLLLLLLRVASAQVPGGARVPSLPAASAAYADEDEATVLIQLRAVVVLNSTVASAAPGREVAALAPETSEAPAAAYLPRGNDHVWGSVGLRYLDCNLLGGVLSSTLQYVFAREPYPSFGQDGRPHAAATPALARPRPWRPALQRVMVIALVSAAAVVILYVVGRAAGRCSGEHEESSVKKLDIICSFLGLVISFGWYGVVQEYIMTSEYGNERFPSAVFLVFVNRIFIVSFSSLVLLAQRKPASFGAWNWTALPSVTNCISSYCQHEALLFVTFPVASVFKSCKIVPTMIVNTLVNGERHEWMDYAIAFVITACVSGFCLSTDATSNAPTSNAAAGLLMMGLFLFCDAITSTGQKRIYSAHPLFGHVEMMFCVGLFSLLYTAIALELLTGFSRMFAFLSRNPEAIWHVCELSISTTAGQYLMFYVIQQNGPVTLAVMMTVRQVFSIVVSSVLFDHPLGPTADLCAMGAFLAVIAKPVHKQAGSYLKCSSDVKKASPCASPSGWVRVDDLVTRITSRDDSATVELNGRGRF